MNQEETGGPTGHVHAEVAKLGFESRAIHAGYDPDPTTGAVGHGRSGVGPPGRRFTDDGSAC